MLNEQRTYSSHLNKSNKIKSNQKNKWHDISKDINKNELKRKMNKKESVFKIYKANANANLSNTKNIREKKTQQIKLTKRMKTNNKNGKLRNYYGQICATSSNQIETNRMEMN